MNRVPAIVTHGGAGTWVRKDGQRGAEGCARAAAKGLDILANGGTALDAAQAAVRVLEDDPLFNAGTGAALTRDGGVELDAAVMDGKGLRFGAIGAVPDIRNPVDLARLVLEDGEHCLLVGEAAWDFAEAHGMMPAPSEALITEDARRRLERERRRRQAGTDGGGTVGACAIDVHGHLAAATSTGGIVFKRRGRVGDSPLPGCGTYADDRGGAASATGNGESIMRVGVTRTVVEALRAGASATTAAQAAIAELQERVGGKGGVICIDRQGRIGLAHNTPAMTFAFATADRPAPVSGLKWDGGSLP